MKKKYFYSLQYRNKNLNIAKWQKAFNLQTALNNGISHLLNITMYIIALYLLILTLMIKLNYLLHKIYKHIVKFYQIN